MNEHAGKRKCQILKELRRAVAEEYDIEFEISECKHRGDCRGVCPKCDEEVLQLVSELKRRNIVISGVVAASICAAVAGGSYVKSHMGKPLLPEWNIEDNNLDSGVGGWNFDLD